MANSSAYARLTPSFCTGAVWAGQEGPTRSVRALPGQGLAMCSRLQPEDLGGCPPPLALALAPADFGVSQYRRAG
eukprot:CAMPEP_0179142394 /NCGR_PEP_ID=MMETSP0796-20121207/68383_1 /TAXON_ID=73915 /ORGANISM="Pyrodinium bahamense, Strain pbaha01" /LENGTH=74 /DNA_ID=CAMNT_0020842255 /DNA_START=51 /DNA_END=271 /DNA_ORIENTATION=+